MALAISNVPILTDEVAERLEREAECNEEYLRSSQYNPEAFEMVRRVEENTRQTRLARPTFPDMQDVNPMRCFFPRIQTMSFFVILCITLTISACTKGNQGLSSSDGQDSLYTWQYIKKIHLEEPERALALTDTAETRGLICRDSCNWIRGVIFYGAIKDYPKAKAFCQLVLDRQKDEKTGTLYLKGLKLMAAICLTDEGYNSSLRYCIEGAALAHEADDAILEADFNFQAGSCMERMNGVGGRDQKGASKGIAYMDKAIETLRQLDDIKTLPTLSYYLGQKMRYLSHREEYSEAVNAGKQRLGIIERMKREYDGLPDGFIDEQQARAYSVLAYCQQKLGQTAQAKESLEAFLKTDFSKTPDGKNDILNYYALAGNVAQVIRLYDELAPLNQQDDTITNGYLNLILRLADAYRQTGDFRRADLAMLRAAAITDSIAARDRQAQSLRLAEIYRTQEKDLQLHDKEAAEKLYRLSLLTAIVIILLTVFFLWRTYRYNKVLTEKNRRLYEQVQQREQQQTAQMSLLQQQPEEQLTQSQQLFRHLCKLMDDKQPYTDETLNRETLAQKLGTNYKYVEQAIRECSDGETVADFINRYRIQHVAHLLKNTDTPISIIGELSGIPSRSTLSRQFRDFYGMTPSEYRRISPK